MVLFFLSIAIYRLMFKLIEARVLIFILLLILFLNNVLISKLYAFCLFFCHQSAPKSSIPLLLYERVWWNMEWIIKIVNFYSHICNCNFSDIYGRARKKFRALPERHEKSRLWSFGQFDNKQSISKSPAMQCCLTSSVWLPRSFQYNLFYFRELFE